MLNSASVREHLEERARDALTLCEELLTVSQEANDGAYGFIPVIALCNFTPRAGEAAEMERRGFGTPLVAKWVAAVAEEVERWHFNSLESAHASRNPLDWAAVAMDRALQAVIAAIPSDEAIAEAVGALQREPAGQEVAL